MVVPLYYAAFRYSATKLLANCCNFLLNHYDKVDDPGESCDSRVILVGSCDSRVILQGSCDSHVILLEIPYSEKFSLGANFRNFAGKLASMKIKTENKMEVDDVIMYIHRYELVSMAV